MPFKDYAAELQRNLKSGHATEPTYYPALKSLLENLDSSISVLQNPKKTEHGSPDFRLTRKRTIEFPVGWIEAKLPGENLNKIERSDQLKRYYHLPNLILTDFLEFRWYTGGKAKDDKPRTDGKPRARLSASLATVSHGKLKLDLDGQAKVEELLRGFLAHKTPPAKDSRELARRMAQLAHFIRDSILIAYDAEKSKGVLREQMDAFREALIPDLTPEQFADMYAQTIAYGLFAARCQPPQPGEKFTRERAGWLIPKTNPFLRKLFSVIAGPDLPEEILPYVDDLVALLRDTDIGAIMADFGKRTAKEDPVVHFYEDFLQAYDPKLRELRGVYYTPEPVVSYIVRSIDHILKTEFSKPMGLADKDVLILDPACGTGTFLYYVIRHIYDTLCEHGQKGQWNSYVSENLLKRVFGFELLMTPYAVAHLKLGLQLQELGYKFESDERLGVYLTNTLEEASKKSEIIFAQWIADEANAASKIKRELPVMVVLGNPPYSGISANRGEWISKLLEDYRKVDGKPLGEKKVWLADDYVKFIRFGQWRIDKTRRGILAFITNNGYVDNPTFRGMRESLAKSFSGISIVNLHGNTKKKEVTPDGSTDVNVFEIQQGVAVGIFVKEKDKNAATNVRYSDLWGPRENKYEWLSTKSTADTHWQDLQPTPPLRLFVPHSKKRNEEYEQYWRIDDILETSITGIVTARDDLVVGFEEKSVLQKIQKFLDPNLSDAEVKEQLALGENYAWRVGQARRDLRASSKGLSLKDFIRVVLYRPFNERFIFYDPAVVWRPRETVMRNMLAGKNTALLTTRQTKDMWDAMATRSIAGHKSLSAYDITSIFPLWLYPQGTLQKAGLFQRQDRKPNLNPLFLTSVRKTGIQFVKTDRGNLHDSLGAEDIFDYIYSIFHSPGYRTRYEELLKIDFPRVPLTGNKKLFAALAEKGAELVSLHLMESPKLSHFITKYEQPGEHEVKKVRYAEPNPQAGIKSGRVYINDAQYFEGVPKEVWEFHIGGYQVCEKWLKDRKGRKLSSDDIDHYQKIVVALAETIRIMREIDGIIPGWPLP